MTFHMVPHGDMAYVAGYCLMKRGGCIEIWHYASDQFKRTALDWKGAYEWALENTTIARLPAKAWPNQFYGEDAPPR